MIKLIKTSDYTGRTHNRWIVADTACYTDFDYFTDWTGNDSTYKYPPYHANAHYAHWQINQAVNFMYELSRCRLVNGSQLDLNANNYNNKDEYHGVTVPVKMKKRIVSDLYVMYNTLSSHYGSLINMDSCISRGYMVLGMLLHTVQDMYCHKAKITYNMLCYSADGYIGNNDVFGTTCSDSSISCNIFSYDWSKYWECRDIILKHDGMPMNILKFRMQERIYYIPGYDGIGFTRSQVYEDNPHFYSNRFEVSKYMTESVLNDMKNGATSTALYGFDSWGVPVYMDAVPSGYVKSGNW